MSSSNIGAQKGKNIRDHLFVVNGLMKDIIQEKTKIVDIQIIDVKKCFDKMHFKETGSDIYRAVVQDDQFL